jgi:hypothetical protein
MNELGSFGRIGRYAGEFIFLHNVAVDSKGTSTQLKSETDAASGNSCGTRQSGAHFFSSHAPDSRRTLFTVNSTDGLAD